jgi:hypothetical protein
MLKIEGYAAWLTLNDRAMGSMTYAISKVSIPYTLSEFNMLIHPSLGCLYVQHRQQRVY